MTEYYSSGSAGARARRRKKRRRQQIIRTICFAILFIALVAGLVFLAIRLFGDGRDLKETTAAFETSSAAEEQTTAAADETEPGSTEAETQAPVASDVQDMLDEAKLLAAMYDYDGALELLNSYTGSEGKDQVADLASVINGEKNACVKVDCSTVPHIFFHSCIVDADRCFDTGKWGTSIVNGNNTNMLLLGEFEEVLQDLYDAGWVLVRLRDLVTGEAGSYQYNQSLYLPSGKKALVLSLDDLNYPSSYMGKGFAEKLVLDENNEIKCLYIDASGTEHIGDYDCVPVIDSFIKEHPDFSYRGARGLIALTGYDGVFGYRTDEGFFSKPNSDEQAWIDAHPGTDINEEIAAAKVIAAALKEDGWEFASHSWGHKDFGANSLDWLKTDNGKWQSRVVPIIGKCDTVIFPHGTDIQGPSEYSSSNEKYNYLYEQGFRFFCNVDGSNLYWNQITSKYVRSGRIDIDGYTLYKQITGNTKVIGQLGIDAEAIFSSKRPTPVNPPA